VLLFELVSSVKCNLDTESMSTIELCRICGTEKIDSNKSIGTVKIPHFPPTAIFARSDVQKFQQKKK
jgi:hypothetical protein